VIVFVFKLIIAILLFIAISGVPAILVWRKRSLDPARVSIWRDRLVKPLDAGELQELAHWQVRMLVLYVASIIYLLFLLILSSSPNLPGDQLGADLAYGLLLPLVGAVLYHQFSARCPRCGFTLGLQRRLLVPAHCARCDVRLRPASELDIQE
jgi:hypothetical protein